MSLSLENDDDCFLSFEMLVLCLSSPWFRENLLQELGLSNQAISLSLWNLCKLWNMSHEASQLNYLACGRFCKVPQNPSLFLQQRRSSSSSSSDQTNSIIVRWAAGVFLCVSVCVWMLETPNHFILFCFFFTKGCFVLLGCAKSLSTWSLAIHHPFYKKDGTESPNPRNSLFIS